MGLPSPQEGSESQDIQPLHVLNEVRGSGLLEAIAKRTILQHRGVSPHVAARVDRLRADLETGKMDLLAFEGEGRANATQE